MPPLGLSLESRRRQPVFWVASLRTQWRWWEGGDDAAARGNEGDGPAAGDIVAVRRSW
jgi:hypothetical protein